VEAVVVAVAAVEVSAVVVKAQLTPRVAQEVLPEVVVTNRPRRPLPCASLAMTEPSACRHDRRSRFSQICVSERQPRRLK